MTDYDAVNRETKVLWKEAFTCREQGLTFTGQSRLKNSGATTVLKRFSRNVVLKPFNYDGEAKEIILVYDHDKPDSPTPTISSPVRGNASKQKA